MAIRDFDDPSAFQEAYNVLAAQVLNDPECSRDVMTRRQMYSYLVTRAAEPSSFVPPTERERVIRRILDDWYDWGPLQALIEDREVSDIYVRDSFTLYKKDGKYIESTEHTFRDGVELEEFIRRKLEPTPYRWSLSDPITDALVDGCRLNIIGGPSTRRNVVLEDGTVTTVQTLALTIRKSIYPFTMDEMVDLGTIDASIREFFRVHQVIGDSGLIGGPTNSGKTALLNALTGDTPEGLRNLAAEENLELSPHGLYWDRLTDRPANAEGRAVITMQRNILNALRMDPDNFYIGELRWPEHFFLFVRLGLFVKKQHMATFHLNVALQFERAIEMAFDRLILETVEGGAGHSAPLAVANLVATTIQTIVTVRDTKHGKRVTAVAQVIGFDRVNKAILWHPVFTYDWRTDAWTFHGVTVDFAERAEAEGVPLALPITAEAPLSYTILI